MAFDFAATVIEMAGKPYAPIYHECLRRAADVRGTVPALGDVLAIIGGMPQDKLKKIFKEFKTEEERTVLNRILLAIGELDTR